MKPDYHELLNEYTLTSTILDKTGTISAMDTCYKMGKKDGAQDVLDWLSKMDYLSDNIDYIIEEWKNQNEK